MQLNQLIAIVEAAIKLIWHYKKENAELRKQLIDKDVIITARNETIAQLQECVGTATTMLTNDDTELATLHAKFSELSELVLPDASRNEF